MQARLRGLSDAQWHSMLECHIYRIRTLRLYQARIETSRGVLADCAPAMMAAKRLVSSCPVFKARILDFYARRRWRRVGLSSPRIAERVCEWLEG